VLLIHVAELNYTTNTSVHICEVIICFYLCIIYGEWVLAKQNDNNDIIYLTHALICDPLMLV